MLAVRRRCISALLLPGPHRDLKQVKANQCQVQHAVRLSVPCFNPSEIGEVAGSLELVSSGCPLFVLLQDAKHESRLCPTSLLRVIMFRCRVISQ